MNGESGSDNPTFHWQKEMPGKHDKNLPLESVSIIREKNIAIMSLTQTFIRKFFGTQFALLLLLTSSFSLEFQELEHVKKDKLDTFQDIFARSENNAQCNNIVIVGCLCDVSRPLISSANCYLLFTHHRRYLGYCGRKRQKCAKAENFTVQSANFSFKDCVHFPTKMGNCSSKSTANESQTHEQAKVIKYEGTSAPQSALQSALATGGDSAPSSSSAVKLSIKNSSLSEEAKRQLAISKIQRQARRKRALKAAKAEQQWKLFADLDTQDELEMLHLAVFMQTLLDIIPNMQANSPQSSPRDGPVALTSPSKINRQELLQHLTSDEETSEEFTPQRMESTQSDTSFVSSASEDFLRSMSTFQIGNDTSSSYAHLDRININDNSVRVQSLPYFVNQANEVEYNITGSKFDANLLLAVIEVYRLGGKLTRNSVMKILSKGYKMLLDQPNVIHMTVGKRDKLTVVGDLHGQLFDLFHIFELSGVPSQHSKYIFNGDFVDRGPKGLEVFIVLLLSYCVEGTDAVCLNRGNHEDRAVNRVYGFQDEVLQKYPQDHLLLEMFLEVFNQLTLFSIINQEVFVVHGGLFHHPEVDLKDLLEIPRREYVLKPPIPYPQCLEFYTSPQMKRKEYLKQLQREALWSDPFDGEGIRPNDRGLGIKFGMDICQQFMERNQFSMIIRSHECVYSGFHLPFLPSHPLNHAPGVRFDFDFDLPPPPERGESTVNTTFVRQNSATHFDIALSGDTSTSKSFSNGSDDNEEENQNIPKPNANIIKPKLKSPKAAQTNTNHNTTTAVSAPPTPTTTTPTLSETTSMMTPKKSFTTKTSMLSKNTTALGGGANSPTSPYVKVMSRRSSSLCEIASYGSSEEDVAPFPPFLCTLFSASNYCDGDNYGAIMEFINHDIDGGQAIATLSSTSQDTHFLASASSDPSKPLDNELHFVIKHYQVTSSNPNNLIQHNEMSLRELILRKKSALLTAFQVCDEENNGLISRSDWSETMIRVTNIKIRWLSMLPSLVSQHCLPPNAVKYREFLDHFSVFSATDDSDDDEEEELVIASGEENVQTILSKDQLSKEQRTAAGASKEGQHPSKQKAMRAKKMATLMDTMYGQRKQLESIFYFFDSNGDGVISLEEFRDGCAKLNALLPSDCQLTNVDRTLQMMDFDGSGTIDINEFFETFRILDAKDGKTDGVLSIARDYQYQQHGVTPPFPPSSSSTSSSTLPPQFTVSTNLPTNHTATTTTPSAEATTPVPLYI